MKVSQVAVKSRSGLPRVLSLYLLTAWAETKKADDKKREEQRKRELQIEEKKKKLDGMMEKVQSRYGEKSLRKGMHLPE